MLILKHSVTRIYAIAYIKSGAKKTGHFLRSVAHQISTLELKLIKRGPNKMS